MFIVTVGLSHVKSPWTELCVILAVMNRPDPKPELKLSINPKAGQTLCAFGRVLYGERDARDCEI